MNRIYGKAIGGFSVLQERKAKKAQQRELSSLKAEVRNLHQELDDLYSRFDMVTDPTQVDACIFEMNALISKYDYAVKQLKTFDSVT